MDSVEYFSRSNNQQSLERRSVGMKLRKLYFNRPKSVLTTRCTTRRKQRNSNVKRENKEHATNMICISSENNIDT